jgi:toxin ParE1/3/4
LISVALSRRADADLDHILDDSIHAHGREVAEAYLRAIDAMLVRLSSFPTLGAPRSDLGEGLRSVPAGEHRIYYRYDRRRCLSRASFTRDGCERHL